MGRRTQTVGRVRKRLVAAALLAYGKEREREIYSVRAAMRGREREIYAVRAVVRGSERGSYAMRAVVGESERDRHATCTATRGRERYT